MKVFSERVQPEIRSSHSMFKTPVHDAVLLPLGVHVSKNSCAFIFRAKRSKKNCSTLNMKTWKPLATPVFSPPLTQRRVPAEMDLHFHYFHNIIILKHIFWLNEYEYIYVLYYLPSGTPIFRILSSYCRHQNLSDVLSNLRWNKGLFRNISTCIQVLKIISSLYHTETWAETGSRAV